VITSEVAGVDAGVSGPEVAGLTEVDAGTEDDAGPGVDSDGIDVGVDSTGPVWVSVAG
jgi:hypothetical protein